MVATAPHNVMDFASETAEGLLETILDCCFTLGTNNAYLPGPLVLVLNPDHAELLAAGGYDKPRIARFVHERAGLSAEHIINRGLAGIGPKAEAAGFHRVTRGPEDVLVTVAGGRGRAFRRDPALVLFQPHCGTAGYLTGIIHPVVW